MASYGTGTQRKIVSWSLTIHPSWCTGGCWFIVARVNQHPPVHQVDGWCTDRILFSIPVPSQLDFFLFALSQPLISVFFFWNFIFSQPPTQFLFSVLLLKLFLPTHLLPPTVPHRPTPQYIWITSRLFLIYLLTYKFKMCYSHPHPPTRPSTVLPTNTLSRCYQTPPTWLHLPTWLPLQ